MNQELLEADMFAGQTAKSPEQYKSFLNENVLVE